MLTRLSCLVLVATCQIFAAEVAEAQNVTELYVTPDTVRLQPGQRQGLTVQAFDDGGNVVLSVKYSSLDSAVARVARNGTVTAAGPGAARVVVQAGKKTRTIWVVVGARRGEAPLAARSGAQVPSEVGRLETDPASLVLLPTEIGRVSVRAFTAGGALVPGARVHWRSLRTAVATVEDSTGVITGLSTGQAIIQAIAPGGPTVDVQVSVALAPLGLDRTRVLLSPDETDTVRVLVPSQENRPLHSADLQWSVSDDAVAEVSSDGVVRALAAGRAELIVHGFLQELRIPILVHQRVARFAVAPSLSDLVRLPANSTREFTLLPQTVDSVPIEGVPVAWSVGDTAVARFDSVTGTLTALRPGKTTLQFAVHGFLPKAWAIEVIPGTVSLGRTRLSLRPGERFAFSPQFVDSAGSPVVAASGLSWITSNAGVVRVSPDGTVEALAPGRAVITAEAPGGRSTQATVFVSGDLLVSSSRSGHFGVYTLLTAEPDNFMPLVVDTSANSVDASYSPDRTRIVYSSDRNKAGSYDIFVADADGRNPVRLTTDPAMDLRPVWTPDGQRIVFVSARAGGVRQLYVMRADGTEKRELTSLPGGAEDPVVSPDGRAVAFRGYPDGRGGQSDILVVPIEGGTPRRATNTPDRREVHPLYLASGELVWVELRRDKRDPDLVVRQPPAGGLAAPILASEDPLVDVALAGDGSRLAWITAKADDKNRTAYLFTFQWRSLATGTQTSVRLMPGERITSPAY
jgi:WD40-like Beta Propeller Repeat/Bacterial Ig-like domain (group 2)